LLSQGASVSAAAKGAGYARRSLYRWRAAAAELAAAWDDALDALEIGTDILEDEALRRAGRCVV
jgi:transposase-like protein